MAVTLTSKSARGLHLASWKLTPGGIHFHSIAGARPNAKAAAGYVVCKRGGLIAFFPSLPDRRDISRLHPASFARESFVRLSRNSIFWQEFFAPFSISAPRYFFTQTRRYFSRALYTHIYITYKMHNTIKSAMGESDEKRSEEFNIRSRRRRRRPLR